MMDVDPLRGNKIATPTVVPLPTTTSTLHAQNENPCISVLDSGITMSSVARSQDICQSNYDANIAATTSLEAEDAINMPPPPPTVPGSPTMRAVDAPFSSQTQKPPFTQQQQYGLVVEEKQQSQPLNIPSPSAASLAIKTTTTTTSVELESTCTLSGVKSPISQWTEAAIVAAPDLVVSRPQPSQLTSVTHSLAYPTSSENGPLTKTSMASLPPPSSIAATNQISARATPPTTNPNIPNRDYLVPSTMLNPLVVPSSISSNPSAEAGSIHHRPVMVPSTLTNIIMSPPSPNSNSKNIVCSSSSTIAAASASGAGGDGLSPKKKCVYPLRRGKWTTEEESYANRLIHEFKSGLLPLTDGTTLRNFLSKLLNCDPMRISKKFVGNNCIGKQVFRRRVPEINRLTPEQIRMTCVELSELERRFFDRVIQTNRVKSSGVAAALAPGSTMTGIGPNNSATMNMLSGGGGKLDMEFENNMKPPTPPWLRPPRTYKPKGKFARKAVVATTVPSECISKPAESATQSVENAKFSTENSTEKSELSNIASDGIPRTESALEQLARTASAAKFVEDIVNGEIALESEGMGDKLSQSTLQGSFEALMSMDLQSVENLVELAATSNSSAILSELNKNYSESLKYNQSSANLSTRMESFIKSLSNANLLKTGLDSQQALGCLLNASCSNFFDAEKFFKRGESSGVFPQLNGEDGLDNGSHNSVEDFLSLVASGDIPHQDPNMLQVPLQKIMQSSGIGSSACLKRKLSQQQLVALASRLAPGVNSTAKKRKKK